MIYFEEDIAATTSSDDFTESIHAPIFSEKKHEHICS